ncbi:pyridoxal phosphate-dependent decarboxylase family protein [Bacillus thermotolerans]|uniref:pyridoxal phosphate-dependent decarboxylase family protein n=1 Tax=Bacillus thermotolerans TaxID=1221996 RepID=UPI00057D864B|nr:aspartate aminotransferase family protein [Bacillus thermotolerans]KKB38628.1 Siderophore biosynthesis L-2,4-diaminobutyrate decarboxylase [Bacillus thermotolerans]
MNTAFTKWFLHPGHESISAYYELMDRVVQLVADQTRRAYTPFTGVSDRQIASKVKRLLAITQEGQQTDKVMEEIEQTVMKDSLWISHPSAMAHLHCPPLVPSIAAEVVINALNQSMDSWDQSPAATYVEEELIKFLAKQIGYTHEADGVFTSGGTQSNYMGMLLARNWACQRHFSMNVQKEGLPFEADRLRILCSEHAHFTVQQSAAQLGLGINAVVTVKTDDQKRMCIREARAKVHELRQQGLIPFMIVATAGTTDFGSIDPLIETAQLADDEHLWLHVDAAYGGAMLFSHQYKDLLNGLPLADSVTIDFHKLYYQSISCGAFFVKNKRNFRYIAHYADYLNPQEDGEAGILNLVEKSVQTTKRFDALKLLMTFKLIGTDTFGEMVDYTIQLAKETARLFREDPCFEVINDPEINAVVFRYLPAGSREAAYINDINLELQRSFYRSGELIMAKTKQAGDVYLKFTMLNPLNTIGQMKEHLQKIKRAGKAIEEEKGEMQYGYSLPY